MQAPVETAPGPATPWRTLIRDPHFAPGAWTMAPIAPGILAWGLVTGVAMVSSGLPVWAALLMSLTVFAGTAQLAAAPLLAVHASMPVIWLTATALNLRFVIFSAQWRHYFGHLPLRRKLLIAYVAGDLNFVQFVQRWPVPEPEHGQEAFFFGGAAVNFSAWHIGSLAGIALAQWVDPAWGLAFAGTMALVGMTLGLMRDRATWLPVIVAGAAAVAAHALPLRLHVLVAIAAAIVIGLSQQALSGRVRLPSARDVPDRGQG